MWEYRTITESDVLMHSNGHKYIDRKMGKNGKYIYTYANDLVGTVNKVNQQKQAEWGRQADEAERARKAGTYHKTHIKNRTELEYELSRRKDIKRVLSTMEPYGDDKYSCKIGGEYFVIGKDQAKIIQTAKEDHTYDGWAEQIINETYKKGTRIHDPHKKKHEGSGGKF